MAKIKKRKLRWTASDSPQVVGYKLYWSEGGEKVSYESPSEKLGNVTEIVLPDDVASFSPGSGPIEFGVTAVDELGNESDLITIAAPYQFNAPKAPGEFWIEGAEKSPSPLKVPTSHPAQTPISLSHRSIKEDAAPQPKATPPPGMGTGQGPNRQNVSVALRQTDSQRPPE